MAARKRKNNESYKKYRRNLKVEDAKLKRRLKGQVIWPGQWGTAFKVMIHGKPYFQNNQHTMALT